MQNLREHYRMERLAWRDPLLRGSPGSLPCTGLLHGWAEPGPAGRQEGQRGGGGALPSLQAERSQPWGQLARAACSLYTQDRPGSRGEVGMNSSGAPRPLPTEGWLPPPSRLETARQGATKTSPSPVSPARWSQANPPLPARGLPKLPSGPPAWQESWEFPSHTRPRFPAGAASEWGGRASATNSTWQL